MKSICLVLLLSAWFRINAYNQVGREVTDYPDLINTGMVIENTIQLDISPVQYSILRSTTGEKCEVAAKWIVINRDTLKSKEISTRGQSTLMFERKSLNFKIKSKARFRHGDRTESMKNFLLLNLSMDKYYCRNRLAFEMMELLDLFDLFYSFCELQINDKSEGVFMILERPEDWAFKEAQSPVVIRRGYDHSIDKIKSDHKTDRADAKTYKRLYIQMYKTLKEFEGEALYQALLEYIDVDFYMKWLAFNFLVHNGDYSDEVFFYLDPEINKFRIIPWDYDDIFAVTPHEGLKQRYKMIGNKLIFSSEDLLDIKIATDPYLYEVYLEKLKEVLETLTPDVLKHVFEKTFAELYPYYSNPEIIGNVQYDHYNDASLEKLKGYLYDVYRILSSSRKSYLEKM
jgi:spore coat protein H